MSVLDAIKRLEQGVTHSLGVYLPAAPQAQAQRLPIQITHGMQPGTANPQLAGGANAVQPQPIMGQNFLSPQGSPYGVNRQTLQSVGGLADQYDTYHPAQTIPGQVSQLPAYHDLSGKQHPSQPLSGGLPHVLGQGIVTNAWHALFGR